MCLQQQFMRLPVRNLSLHHESQHHRCLRKQSRQSHKVLRMASHFHTGSLLHGRPFNNCLFFKFLLIFQWSQMCEWKASGKSGRNTSTTIKALKEENLKIVESTNGELPIRNNGQFNASLFVMGQRSVAGGVRDYRGSRSCYQYCYWKLETSITAQ